MRPLVAFAVALALAVGWLTWARPSANAGPAVTEAKVISETITVFEDRFGNDPYRYPDGNRLIDLYMLRFQSEAGLDDLERAEEIARLVLPAADDRASARARLALVLISRHGFREAYEHARFAVEANPANTAALAALFDAALALGRYSEAEEALGAMKPGTAARRLREARWLSAHGELAEAARLMRRACERLETSGRPPQVVAWCLTQLADIEQQRSGPEVGRAWLERALEADPGSRGALEGLADLAYAQREWTEAERLYRRIEAEAHPDVYLRLAEVHRELGDGELARQYEARFLRVANDVGAEALFAHELAIYLAGADRWAERGPTTMAVRALAIAERDVERRPSAESYEVLAWVRLQRGEPREALAALEAAPEWGEPNPSALYIRGRVLEALGRRAEAAPLFVEALTDPTLLPPHILRELD